MADWLNENNARGEARNFTASTIKSPNIELSFCHQGPLPSSNASSNRTANECRQVKC
jgi:hypothetical protein